MMPVGKILVVSTVDVLHVANEKSFGMKRTSDFRKRYLRPRFYAEQSEC